MILKLSAANKMESQRYDQTAHCIRQITMARSRNIQEMGRVIHVCQRPAKRAARHALMQMRTVLMRPQPRCKSRSSKRMEMKDRMERMGRVQRMRAIALRAKQVRQRPL